MVACCAYTVYVSTGNPTLTPSILLVTVNTILSELLLPVIPDLCASVLLATPDRLLPAAPVAARLCPKPGLPEQVDDEDQRDGCYHGSHNRVVYLSERKIKNVSSIAKKMDKCLVICY